MPPRRPPLTVELILAWADDHHARTGRWPSRNSGPVQGVPGENWYAINQALADGRRGLPGGSSLARLLAERRGKRRGSPLGRLTAGQILGWAERHFRRTGRWPSAASGAVADAPAENWRALNTALREGRRGLPGGGSLARLLRTGRRSGRARDRALARRDREIAAARSRGESLQEIADRYGLSRQRAEQIVREERRRRALQGERAPRSGGRQGVKAAGAERGRGCNRG
jgi:hypothetical protein